MSLADSVPGVCIFRLSFSLSPVGSAGGGFIHPNSRETDALPPHIIRFNSRQLRILSKRFQRRRLIRRLSNCLNGFDGLSARVVDGKDINIGCMCTSYGCLEWPKKSISVEMYKVRWRIRYPDFRFPSNISKVLAHNLTMRKGRYIDQAGR